MPASFQLLVKILHIRKNSSPTDRSSRGVCRVSTLVQYAVYAPMLSHDQRLKKYRGARHPPKIQCHIAPLARPDLERPRPVYVYPDLRFISCNSKAVIDNSRIDPISTKLKTPPVSSCCDALCTYAQARGGSLPLLTPLRPELLCGLLRGPTYGGGSISCFRRPGRSRRSMGGHEQCSGQVWMVISLSSDNTGTTNLPSVEA